MIPWNCQEPICFTQRLKIHPTFDLTNGTKCKQCSSYIKLNVQLVCNILHIMVLKIHRTLCANGTMLKIQRSFDEYKRCKIMYKWYGQLYVQLVFNILQIVLNIHQSLCTNLIQCAANRTTLNIAPSQHYT